MPTRTTLAAAGLIALIGSVPVAAAPLSLDPSAVKGPTMPVELVHGRHRACLLGPAGWHFHDRFGYRIPCGPQRRPLRRYY